jgi:hypothetical protein
MTGVERLSSGSFAALGLAMALGPLGCGKSVDRLQPLSDEDADKHEAPRADGTCHARAEVSEWKSSTHATGVRARENVRLKLDPCGNTIVITSLYIERPFLYGARHFRDGAKDEGFLLRLADDIEHFGLAVDTFGNVIVISEGFLQVVTAAGRMHAGIPDWGAPVGGDFIVAGPDETWLTSGARRALITLPSGGRLWETPWGMNGLDQRTSMVRWKDDSILYSRIISKIPFEEGTVLSVSSHSLYDPAENARLLFKLDNTLSDDPTWYAETALLAVDEKRSRRYLGTTVYNAEPDTHIRVSCRESLLIDIDDEAWKPEGLGFCGALEALELGDDGSLYSLWTVPVETLDAEVHPFEAEATLVRHDPDGQETGRWVLTDTFGRLAQDGSGAMDMKLVDGGKGAIIGALVGGPWNGRFFTHPSNLVVARVPLD